MKDVESFFHSFIYAIKGIFWMVLHERNFRVHLTCLAYMIYFLARYDFFVLTRPEIAILTIAAALVIGGEMINTGIEKADDAVSREKKYAIKVSKDVAAGAVLVFAIASVIVGVIILWQPSAFQSLYEHYKNNPLYLVPLVISFVAGVLFVFRFDAKYIGKKENNDKE